MLGDRHNFGRVVRARGGRIHKPRTVVWERLLLGTDSPLRELLGDDFSFVPRLRFFGSGEVERIALSPLRKPSADAKRSLARIAGRALALFSWFGVADLHWGNLALGVGARGSIVFGPLDVESVLGDFALPTETKLLPTADPDVAPACRHAAGMRRVLPYLGKPVAARHVVAMAAAYRAALELLGSRSKDIAQQLARTPGLMRAPIRVMLRGTDEYVRARSQAALFPPLLEAEARQLARGDIPYFFRTLSQPSLRYYADRSLRRTARIPVRGDRMLSLARGLRSRSRRTLEEQGLFVVLAAFDHPALSGTHEEDGLRVTFGRRVLAVKLPSGQELGAPRDLRGVVASVYLPCRCGEVRSVLAREP